jgi:hypothetical protein
MISAAKSGTRGDSPKEARGRRRKARPDHPGADATRALRPRVPSPVVRITEPRVRRTGRSEHHAVARRSAGRPRKIGDPALAGVSTRYAPWSAPGCFVGARIRVVGNAAAAAAGGGEADRGRRRNAAAAMNLPTVTTRGSAGQVQDGVGVRPGLGQRADRLRRGQDDEFDLAAAGLVPDLLHHRQRAVGAAADHQPAASPRDVLRDRQWGVPVLAAELPRRGLLALADLPRSMIRS